PIVCRLRGDDGAMHYLRDLPAGRGVGRPEVRPALRVARLRIAAIVPADHAAGYRRLYEPVVGRAVGQVREGGGWRLGQGQAFGQHDYLVELRPCYLGVGPEVQAWARLAGPAAVVPGDELPAGGRLDVLVERVGGGHVAERWTGRR